MKLARLLPEAAQELEDAAGRIERARPGWGDKLYVEVFDALEHIERNPSAWQLVDDLGAERRFVLRRFPCVLVYRETEADLLITAVAYGGREPGYWRGR